MSTVQRDGVRLTVPDAWHTELGSADGVPIVAIAPAAPGAFRANATVTVGAVPPGMSFRDWQSGTDAILPRTLTEYLLLDLEHVEVGGREAVRRLAHHVADGVPVTMEQWAVLAAGLGVTLTVTAATPDWAVLADVAATVGASLELVGEEER
jgi:hypothetical protein